MGVWAAYRGCFRGGLSFILFLAASASTAYAETAPELKAAHSASPTQEEPKGRASEEIEERPEYSELERYAVERELAALKSAGKSGELELSPEGKRIEAVQIRVLEVFDEQDPVPKGLNRLHISTRERVIRRELLQREGELWNAQLISESARNLRRLPQLSLVLIVALKGETEGAVRLLVLARDVWSLRINWGMRFQGGKVEQFLLQPSETNLFGTHRSVSGLMALQLDRYILGATFVNPRLGPSHIQTTVFANLIFNRETGRSEGSYGGLFYGSPLFSTRTRWGWATNLAWRKEVVRRFVGGALDTYETSEGPVPYVYESDKLAGEYELVRSFGVTNKLDLSVGAEASRQAFGGYGEADGRGAMQEFLMREAPVSDTRISPFFKLQSYSTRYLRTLNLETLGLQEDVQLGQHLLLKVYPASAEVGSSRSLLGASSAVGYTFPVGNGYIRGAGSSRIELSNASQSDAEVEGALRFVSPQLGFGRLVYDGLVTNRFRDYLRRRYALGGHSRPRGYPSYAFIGKDRLASSLELRSRSVQIFGAELGGVAFYEAADAFQNFRELDLNHAVGFGLRGLLPMFDRLVFRLDWGFPVGNRQYASWPGELVFTFNQAFLAPQVATQSVTAGLADFE